MGVVLLGFAFVAIFALSTGGLRGQHDERKGATNLELVVAIAAAIALLVGLVSLTVASTSPCRSYARGPSIGDC